jgi:hypothetical protein
MIGSRNDGALLDLLREPLDVRGRKITLERRRFDRLPR